MKQKTRRKVLSFLSLFSILFQVLSPALVFAQEITPTEPAPTEETAPAPTVEATVVETQAEVPTLTVEPTVTPEPTPAPELPVEEPVISENEVPAETSTTPETETQFDLTESTEAEQSAQPVPSVDTDKEDYTPTELVTITGDGYEPNASLIVEILVDGQVFSTGQATADENGDLVFLYQLDGTYRPLYDVVVKSLAGVVLVSTTFTDTKPACPGFGTTSASEKVTICHATNSHKHPYQVNTPSMSGDVQGHDDHDGLVWFPGITVEWGDIIPEFDYEECGETKHYPGQNLTTEGQAILDNGCKVPGETVEDCGDGIVNDDEACDFGDLNGGDSSCSDACDWRTVGEYCETGEITPSLDTVDIDGTNVDPYSKANWSPATGKPEDSTYGEWDEHELIGMVVGPGLCTSDTEAEFTIGETGKYLTELRVRALDGISYTDSFDIYLNNIFLAHYEDNDSDGELWGTLTYPVPGPSGNGVEGPVTVKFVSVDDPWNDCETWGQVAINWVEVDGYTCDQPVCEDPDYWTCEECQTLISSDDVCYDDFVDYCGIEYGCFPPQLASFAAIGTDVLPSWSCTDTCQPVCVDEEPGYADEVIAYVEGTGVSDDRDDPQNALGQPDSPQPTVNFVSLGLGGGIIVKFDKYVVDVAGNDLSFHEITWGDRMAWSLESAEVSVSQDQGEWKSLGAVTNHDDITGISYKDISGTGWSWIQYVKLVDSSVSGSVDGYDLDAVDASYEDCDKPEPREWCGDGIVNGEEDCDGGLACTDKCTWDWQNNVCQEPAIAETVDPLDRIDLGDSVSEDENGASGWGDDPGGGNYGGRDGGNFALVVGNLECNENGKTASFTMDAGTGYANKLTIRHLDGLSNLDSFDVFINDVFLAQYTDQQDSAEIWYTTEFPLPNITGTFEVKIVLTDEIWPQCATWGQLAVNWVEISGYTCEADLCGDGIVNGNEQCDGGPVCTDQCQWNNICEPGLNMVQNGGFEAPEVTSGKQWDIYDSGTPFMGWSVNWREAFPSFGGWDLPEPAHLELHRGVNGWLSKTGVQHAELDTDWDGPDGSLSNEPASVSIFQSIPTINGYEYKVDFSFSPRPSTGADQNILKFTWDGVEQASLTRAGSGDVDWSDHSYTFMADGDLAELRFTDQGTPDSFGTFIDNVSVTCLGEPEPETSTVTVCKQDEQRNLLSGWKMVLKGDFVEQVDVYPSDALGNTGGSTNYVATSSDLPQDDYLLEANGYYTYRPSTLDAEYTDAVYSKRAPTDAVYGGPYVPWVNVNDFPVPHTGWLGVMVNGSANWSEYFNSDHKYAWGMPGWTGPFTFTILDDYYGDNSGFIPVSIYKGYAEITGENGCVTFEDVPYGEYSLEEILKSGWEYVSGDQGPVVIDASEESFTLVNQEIIRTGSILGYKWGDANGDGDWDADEVGLSGWTIELKNGGTVATTATGSDGSYEFNNVEIIAGIYDVCEEDREGWARTDHPTLCNCVDLDPGEIEQNVNFGNAPTSSIQGRKYNDINGNGNFDNWEKVDANRLNGWTIELYDDSWNNLKSMVTGDDGTEAGNVDKGQYRFVHLNAGTYYLCEVGQADWIQTEPSAGPLNQDLYCHAVNLAAGENRTDIQFGNFKEGYISGRKYSDLNQSGERDFGDEDLNGWVIKLSYKYREIAPNCPLPGIIDGKYCKYTTGDSALLGQYIFRELGPGTYIVEEENQPGWVQSDPTSADPLLGGKDDGTYEIPMTSNGAKHSRHFGNIPFGDITVTKFHDLDGDGYWDRCLSDILAVAAFPTDQTPEICEPVLEGWDIHLIDEATETTDGNGESIFTGLMPGSYLLGETLKDYWEQTGIYCDNEARFETSDNDFRLTSILNDLPEGTHEVMVAPAESVYCYIGNQYNPPVLTIAKSNDATGDKSPGGSLGYTIILHLSGSPLTNVIVTDLLPKWFTYKGGSWKAYRGVVEDPTILEPVYHSPGKWYVGNMTPEEDIKLVYTGDISGDIEPGLYKDLAWAVGTSFLDSPVLAYAEDSIEHFAFVGTQVNVVRDQQNDASHQVEVKVLGASTELPATGANSDWILFALALLIAGVKFVQTGVNLRRKNA